MNTIDVLSDPVKILWTGGWDSTFQLLRLLLSEHRRVEPHYLIDEDRPSTGAELSTMKRIRTTLGEVDEVATELLQPTTLCLVSEIPSRPRISQAFESIQRRRGIGGQYDWLARYCEARGIAGLQLCIHEDDKAALAIAQMIAEGHNDRQPAALDDRYSDTDEYVVFRYFEFPILDLSKTDMADIARACG